MIQTGKFVCPSCLKEIKIEHWFDYRWFNKEIEYDEEIGAEGECNTTCEKKCYKCGKCNCNSNWCDIRDKCRCSWSKIEKKYNKKLNNLLLCEWKCRPSTLFNEIYLEEEVFSDINLISDYLNFVRN